MRRYSGHLMGIMAGILVALLAARAWSFLQQAQELSLASGCSSGLRESEGLFTRYREQHGGSFPKRLDDLDLADASVEALRCPRAPRAGRHAYLYIPPAPGTPEDTPMLICWRHPELLWLTKGGGFRRRKD